jgi:hypothetical protein
MTLERIILFIVQLLLLIRVVSALRVPRHQRGLLSRAVTAGTARWGLTAVPRRSMRLEAKKKVGSDEKFVCESCGVEHIRWVGKCDSCGEWNTVKAFRASRVNPMLPLDPRGSSTPRSPSASGSYNRLSPSSRSSWNPSGAGAGASAYNSSSSVIEMSRVNVSQATARIQLWSPEFNRVLGGGLVRGSATLLAGEVHLFPSFSSSFPLPYTPRTNE